MRKKMAFIGVTVVIGAVAGAFGYWLGRRDSDLDEFADDCDDEDCDCGCCGGSCHCHDTNWGFSEPPTEDEDTEGVFDETEGTDDSPAGDFDWSDDDDVTEDDFESQV